MRKTRTKPGDNHVKKPESERRRNHDPASAPTADDLAAASLAASTRKAYAGGIAYYLAMGYTLPATPTDAVDWLVKVASKLKPATIDAA